ncbi:hypothetical protein ABZ467_32275 [Streptomyces sp. NPDC005727]|uniref:hypothetical protein n=1 Tax=Streptomyces sp. NPDC005727 TaxID=3157053 RepID=UPI0034098BC2
MGLLDGLRVRLALGVLGERPVDAGHRRVVSLASAGGDDQVGLDLLDGLAARAAPEHGVQHAVGDDRRPAAVLALAGRGVEPSSVDSQMFSRSVSAIAAKNANSSFLGPVGS